MISVSSIRMVSLLRARINSVDCGASVNATRPDNVKECAICGVPGVSDGPGSYLSRPSCCEPISVCRGCGKNITEVRAKFRMMHADCPLHSRSRYAEVEYLESKSESKRKRT